MSHQTGPRTPEGKAQSSQNNCQHGLSTANLTVHPGQQSIFDEMEAELRNEVQPDGPLETRAFQRLITAAWQLDQCRPPSGLHPRTHPLLLQRRLRSPSTSRPPPLLHPHECAPTKPARTQSCSAFREIVSPHEYDSLGEDFEKKEHQLFGEGGFEKNADPVASLEKKPGIYDLSQFTPR